LVSLALASGAYPFSPWLMAVPFGIGQLAMAAIVFWGVEEVQVGEFDVEA